jgi:hypothetical protein
MRGLSLLANLRYDDRNDKTPVVDYFPTVVTGTATGVNEPRSIKTTAASSRRATASLGFRVIGGLDYEEKKRNTSDIRSSASGEDRRNHLAGRVAPIHFRNGQWLRPVREQPPPRVDWVTTTQVTAAGPPPVIGIAATSWTRCILRTATATRCA